MSRIRIEWVPIQVAGLGYFGFDHLQICYQQFDMTVQDEWFVIEGIRGSWFLEAGGADGQTTLAEANPTSGDPPLAQYGQDLINAIGTPTKRGSRALPVLDPFNTWVNMTELAQDMDSQFVYSILGIPGTVIPSSNSSSLIASLLFHSGVDISNHIPYGMRRTSGLHTLLGTQQADELTTTEHFNTIQSGRGNDILRGTDASERFYGGLGDDIVFWSKGSNLIHGGQWRMPYAEDGTDTMDFSGAGHIVIMKNPARVEGASPDYVVRHTLGRVDHLYSIERVQWSAGSDTFELEDVQILEDGLLFRMGLEDSAGGDRIELAGLNGGVRINPTDHGELAVQAIASTNTQKASWLESVESVLATNFADVIYADTHLRVIEGGGGNDLIDARLATAFEGSSPNGFDAELIGGDGNDTLVGNNGHMLLNGGVGADTFIVSALSTSSANKIEIVIEGGDSSDRLYIPYNFFNGSNGTYEGSELMPVLGGIGEPVQTGQGIYAFFDWQTEEQRWFGTNSTLGIITFVGAIEFDLQGSDLLVHLFAGTVTDFTWDYGNGPVTTTYAARRWETETIVRIKSFQEGQLGINFYDLQNPQSLRLPNGSYVLHYPEYNAAVQALTANGARLAPLDARPDALEMDTSDGPPTHETAGTSGADTIAATLDDNRVRAGAGNDSITTGSGDDFIDGEAGADTMQGGAGNDTYIVDSSSDVVIEATGAGNDTVYSAVSYTLAATLESLTLLGEAVTGTGHGGADLIGGSEGNNLLLGLAGDDTLAGFIGDDTLVGGAGNDLYGYTTGDGIDVVHDQGTLTDLDVLSFTPGIDPQDVTVVRPMAAPQDLLLLLSDGGRVWLKDFGTGPAASVDQIRFSGGIVWTRATLEGFAATAPLETNAAPTLADDYQLVMTGLSTTLMASTLLANDRDVNGDPLTITAVGDGQHVAVSLDAGGNVVITAQAGYQGVASFTYTVSDGQGNSATANVEITVDGGPGGAMVAGNMGNDEVVGTAADEILDGYTGDDTLVGGGGADQLYGGTGLDWASYANATAAVGVNMLTAEFGAGDAEGDTFHSVEGVIGSAFDDDIQTQATATQVRAGDGDDNVIGNAGRDVLSGEGGSDNLSGGTGDDTLTGGAGVDGLNGNDGNDLIDAATGDGAGVQDQISGGLGNDTFLVNGDDLVTELAGEGIDTLVASSDYTLPEGVDVEVLRGNTTGAATLTGNELSQQLANDPGSMAHLVGGGGSDTMTGEAGADFLHGDFDSGTGPGIASGDSLSGMAGNDTLYGETGNDTLLGGAGLDLIYGGGENDNADGGSEADTIHGETGNDTLAGGDGDDSLYGGNDNDTIDGGAGNDTLLGSDGADTLSGEAGVDSLLGGAGSDLVNGGIDNDWIDGGGDNDTANGDDGNDTLLGADGDDALNGIAGNDSLVGQAGLDTLAGGAGLDTLIGGPGTDSLLGGDGDDRLDGVTDEGTAARDTLAGGLGNDTYVTRGDDVVSEAANAGIDVVLARTTYTLSAGASVELLQADANGIIVIGNDLGQTLAISSGIIAQLRGGGGSDTVVGSGAAETLWGDFGGGTGPGAAGNDVIYGNAGNDSIYGEAGHDELGGEQGNDRVQGGIGNDTLYGGSGLDTMLGDAGDDRLYGGDDNDSLTGGTNNDMLFGELGSDTLVGEAGLDTLVGGDGADRFVFRAGFGRDTIADFAAGDIIDLVGFGATYADLVFTQTAAGLEISSVKLGTPNVIVVANATAPIDQGQLLL